MHECTVYVGASLSTRYTYAWVIHRHTQVTRVTQKYYLVYSTNFEKNPQVYPYFWLDCKT